MVELKQRVEGVVRIIKLDEAKILDEHFAKQVGTDVNKIANEMRQKVLLLNLEKVQFMASAMIGQLVVVRENCRRRGIDLAICDMNKNLCEAIKLMRIDEILKVYDTERDALESLAQTEAQ